MKGEEMDVIAFIEKDVRRERLMTPAIAGFFALVIAVFPAAFGILLRDSTADVFDPRTFVPNALAACMLLSFPILYGRRIRFTRSAFAGVMLGLGLALIFSTERIYFPMGVRTTYLSSDIFWSESFKCFAKGAVAVVIAGLLLCLFAFKFSSWPSRRWRFSIALSAGVSGAVMLGFHCDSSSFGHVVVGHIGPGVLLGGAIFLIEEALFSKRLKAAFPKLDEKIANLGKIG